MERIVGAYEEGSKVLSLAEETFQRKTQLQGKDACITLMLYLCHLYEKAGQVEEAIQVSEGAVEIEKRCDTDPSSDKSRNLQDLLYVLALCQERKENFRDAISLVEEAYKGRERLYGEEKGMVFILISLYKRTEQRAEVERCQRLHERLKAKKLGWNDEPPEGEDEDNTGALDDDKDSLSLGSSEYEPSERHREELKELSELFERMLRERKDGPDGISRDDNWLWDSSEEESAEGIAVAIAELGKR
jgi:tetratricopeptide (TPR) repeat protein